MIGKASEVNIAEMEVSNVNGWLDNNRDVIVMDIKYAFYPEGYSWALIIYKEADTNA